MFIRVHTGEWRYSQSCFYFRHSFVNCCPSSLRSGSISPPPLPPPFSVWISILYTRIQCVCGGGYGMLGLRQINTGRKIPLQVNFFRWRHFALPSMSPIFLRLRPKYVMYISVRIHVHWRVISKKYTELKQFDFLAHHCEGCHCPPNHRQSPLPPLPAPPRLAAKSSWIILFRDEIGNRRLRNFRKIKHFRICFLFR